MAKRPQFSLQYLFLEVFWVASALGCATQASRMESSNLDVMRGLLALYAVLCSGTAIGGLFHKMKTGFLITAGLIGVGAVAMMLSAVLAFLLDFGCPAWLLATWSFKRFLEFTCRDCGRQEIRTAWQQQWWYEVAKGPIYSTAVRCSACRRARRGGAAEGD